MYIYWYTPTTVMVPGEWLIRAHALYFGEAGGNRIDGNTPDFTNVLVLKLSSHWWVIQGMVCACHRCIT